MTEEERGFVAYDTVFLFPPHHVVPIPIGAHTGGLCVKGAAVTIFTLGSGRFELIFQHLYPLLLNLILLQYRLMPSAQTFTQSDAVDMKKERDWAANIGMMDWDTTSIVFTKRSLIEFLKYTGTTVDPNFVNISKLPKYAKFGKITSEEVEAETDADAEATLAEAEGAASGPGGASDFRPSRRVRTTPGGPTSNIFEAESPDDALSQAPSLGGAVEVPQSADNNNVDEADRVHAATRPSRRVRTAPGGEDSLAKLWLSAETTVESKPTRRVRQAPGGKDSVSSVRYASIILALKRMLIKDRSCSVVHDLCVQKWQLLNVALDESMLARVTAAYYRLGTVHDDDDDDDDDGVDKT
ncbi:hypothetical protein M0805_003860 [Coniferiporia weirii]|nr:hypothetical protein M0805_003860 [Coniferiporia weirii]